MITLRDCYSQTLSKIRATDSTNAHLVSLSIGCWMAGWKRWQITLTASCGRTCHPKELTERCRLTETPLDALKRRGGRPVAWTWREATLASCREPRRLESGWKTPVEFAVMIRIGKRCGVAMTIQPRVDWAKRIGDMLLTIWRCYQGATISTCKGERTWRQHWRYLTLNGATSR